MRRIALLTALLCLVVAAPASAHTYRGKTRDGGRIMIRMAPSGGTMIVLRAQRELSCRKDGVRSFRQGGFRQSRPFVGRGGGSLYRGSIRTRGAKGSLVRRGRFSIRAIVTEGRARGVFRERTRLRDGTRCTSGRVRFSIPLVSTNSHG